MGKIVICDSCGKQNDFAFIPSLKFPNGVPNPGNPAMYCDNFECHADLRQQRLDRLMNYDPWALRVFGRIMMIGFPLILMFILSHPVVGIEDGRSLGFIIIPSTVLLWWWISRDDWH